MIARELRNRRRGGELWKYDYQREEKSYVEALRS